MQPSRKTSPPATDRRQGGDRRKVDKGPPPGRRERRVSTEPRQPDVEELDVSLSDWARLQSGEAAPKK
jgi:hypothetical protein